MGRLVMDGNVNDSVVFFTLADVHNGRLFYMPFEVDGETTDSTELQLDADGIQPARFRLVLKYATTTLKHDEVNYYRKLMKVFTVAFRLA